MSTLLAADLLAACSALGHYNGSKYFLDDQCLETAKDLMRFLRRDDETFEIRRMLGSSQILRSDLLPLMHETANQPEFFDITLRLMVNLTNPALMLFKEKLPKDKIERNHFLQIIGHLQEYKQAFAEDRFQVWDVIREKMNDILQIEVSERDEDQSVLVERCLILVRNILHVPADPNEEKRPDNDANVHDKLLWSLHTSGMKLIILYLASNKAEHAYYMHVLEIMSLMFREQNPEVLASAHFNRSEQEKERDEKALAAVSLAEQKLKLQKLKNAAGSRHSRFGGTFTVRGMKSISDEDLILHRPLKSLQCDSIDSDLDKKLRKIPKMKLPMIEESCERRSAFTVRLMLKEFCVEFLTGAYNHLMSTVKSMLDRQSAQANDETYFLWGVKFFMEFNRHYGFRVELVSETMNVAMFHFITMQVGSYRESMTTDKERVKLWSTRLHVAVRAYGELLLTLCFMDKDPNPSVRSSSKIFKSNIFYLAEYREILLSLLVDYNQIKFSDRCLKDLIETVHVFLKLLESFCTTRSLLLVETVCKKKRTNKKKKPVASPPIPKEQLWAEIGPELSSIIANYEVVPGEYCPFDATLDRDIDDQKADAMCKVQTLMRKRKLEESVGILRASREVWPENDIFGSSNMTADEEIEAMHEIFTANIQADAPPTPPLAEADSESEEEGPEMVSTETSFEFKDFVYRFAHENVIRNCGLLLKRFKTNSNFTNHCVCKLLHRIAFTLKEPVMLFQLSLFMTFQQILHSEERQHKELTHFVRYIMQQLKEVAEKNSTIFREMLFWKNNRISYLLQNGEDITKAGSKHKKAWAEEEEDELHRLREEFVANNCPGGDLPSWVMKNLVRQDRSKVSLMKKLREFGYVAVAGSRQTIAPEEWDEEEEKDLAEFYQQFKEHADPVAMILASLRLKRNRKQVIGKLLELGLITSKNQVAKKKDNSKANARYKSAEFVEDEPSSSDDDDDDDSANGQAVQCVLSWPKQLSEVKRCSKLCKEKDGSESLVWLVDQLKAEAEERRSSLDDPDECDALLIPDITKIAIEFETDAFKKLFTNMGLIQDVFLKIPAKMTPQKICDLAAAVQEALAGGLQDLVSLTTGRMADSSSETSLCEEVDSSLTRRRSAAECRRRERQDGGNSSTSPSPSPPDTPPPSPSTHQVGASSGSESTSSSASSTPMPRKRQDSGSESTSPSASSTPIPRKRQDSGSDTLSFTSAKRKRCEQQESGSDTLSFSSKRMRREREDSGSDSSAASSAKPKRRERQSGSDSSDGSPHLSSERIFGEPEDSGNSSSSGHGSMSLEQEIVCLGESPTLSVKGSCETGPHIMPVEHSESQDFMSSAGPTGSHEERRPLSAEATDLISPSQMLNGPIIQVGSAESPGASSSAGQTSNQEERPIGPITYQDFLFERLFGYSNDEPPGSQSPVLVLADETTSSELDRNKAYHRCVVPETSPSSSSSSDVSCTALADTWPVSTPTSASEDSPAKEMISSPSSSTSDLSLTGHADTSPVSMPTSSAAQDSLAKGMICTPLSTSSDGETDAREFVRALEPRRKRNKFRTVRRIIYPDSDS